jgi:acyl-CoA reductase-like NAD-dependent aldehyde dehydrogenase
MNTKLLNPFNPATGEMLSAVKIFGEEEVKEAVTKARAAFQTWRYTTVEERAALLNKIADVLESRAPELGKTITSEMGRVLAESIPEVTKSAAFFRYFARIAGFALRPEALDIAGLTLPQKKAKILYEPRGVVGVIKPWNAPIQQIVWAVAPALMAGCTVVVKPSEFTPHSALGLQSAFEEAGGPDGVLTTVTGDEETGRALTNEDIDLVAFTGSVAAGREVAATMGARLRKCVLELSGKDALIVDVNVRNLDLVASGIVYGAFSNCGHWCSSIERVYIPRGLWDRLVPMVCEKTAALRVGDGSKPGMDVGAVANLRQFEIVSELVADAVSVGAALLIGGHRLVDDGMDAGWFYAPTILANVPAGARLTRENVFGPVVALYPYETVNDALALANDTNYGLGLSVWTDDEEFADYVTRRSDTGMVWVNEPLQSLAACPWSVYKDSGIGCELGVAGLREFTFEKVVQEQFEGNDARRPWYFPYPG